MARRRPRLFSWRQRITRVRVNFSTAADGLDRPDSLQISMSVITGVEFLPLSRLQWLSDCITPQTIDLFHQAIQANPVAYERVRRSYQLMLDFYGIRLEDPETGKLERADHWKPRFTLLNRCARREASLYWHLIAEIFISCFPWCLQTPPLTVQPNPSWSWTKETIDESSLFCVVRLQVVAQLSANHTHSEVAGWVGLRALQMPSGGVHLARSTRGKDSHQLPGQLFGLLGQHHQRWRWAGTDKKLCRPICERCVACDSESWCIVAAKLFIFCDRRLPIFIAAGVRSQVNVDEKDHSFQMYTNNWTRFLVVRLLISLFPKPFPVSVPNHLPHPGLKNANRTRGVSQGTVKYCMPLFLSNIQIIWSFQIGEGKWLKWWLYQGQRDTDLG